MEFMWYMRVEHVPMSHFILFLSGFCTSCLRSNPELAVLFSDPPIPPKMDPSLRVFFYGFGMKFGKSYINDMTEKNVDNIISPLLHSLNICLMLHE